jgi:hypothetical protein
MPDKWITESKPAADLHAIDPDPLDRGDGTTVQRYTTDKGVVHARVVEPSGFVLWMQLQKSP